MNENYKTCISDDSIATEILVSKFLLVMEIMMQWSWVVIFYGDTCMLFLAAFDNYLYYVRIAYVTLA